MQLLPERTIECPTEAVFCVCNSMAVDTGRKA